MNDHIIGLHHITAIAGSAKRNLDFYSKVLGLRLVKKTVNFDDPGTYHFYFGDEKGSPGSILTFFPWQDMRQGRRGTGMVTEIGYSVPEGSLDFWMKHFEKHNVIYNKPSEKFGELYLPFIDPDGLKLELIVSSHPDHRTPFLTAETSAAEATKGFHNVTISLQSIKGTASVLTDIFGYRLEQEHVNRFRFKTDAIDTANIVDLVEVPGEHKGQVAGGSVHHVAFRVKDEETLMRFREKVLAKGLPITDKIDRNYFYSLYFREPGGVLFEIATDNPGFAVDENESELGTYLKLPSQYESRRKEIEKILPKLD
jgi:glyoxalase family protein